VEHDATHAGGGYLLPERLYSPIPDNLAGVVADESVAVSIAGLPPIANQQQLNEYVLSLLSGASFDVDSILTSGGEVLVNADGNVLVSG
jgi:threonine dehydratase